MKEAEFKFRSVRSVDHVSSSNYYDSDGADLSQRHTTSSGRTGIKTVYLRKSQAFIRPLKH